jgi:hypothetical protein
MSFRSAERKTLGYIKPNELDTTMS